MVDYSAKGHYYHDEIRFELQKLLPLLGKQAKLLDVGAGYGNNTRALLEAGHCVVAVEPNVDAVRALRKLQKLYPGRLTVVRGSVTTYRPTEKFDAVICCMVVHFLENSAAGRQAIQNMQSWTKPDGLNLITCYTDGQQLSEDYTFLLQPCELRQAYGDWSVGWYEESFRLTPNRVRKLADVAHLLLGRRGFKAARIIARKPSERLR